MVSIAFPQNTQSIKETLRAYRDLLKIRIVLLLVFTTITAMFVAAKGMPAWSTLFVTVLGGMCAAGGSSAVNQYIDREMDAKMKRTARRPIPSGRVEPINALLFGWALIAWSVFMMGIFVNWLAAGLSFIGAIYYLWFYTIVLKRNTSISIVIGGAAGAIPVLVGWAAVTGTLTIEAWLLFAIIVYWTPPHSWALAILVNSDYAAAGVPMMPVMRGEALTRRQILLYSIQLVIVTLLPGLGILNGADMLGFFYLLVAIISGGGMIYMAVWLVLEPSKALARGVYKYSSLYLTLLFLAMILDRVIYSVI